jgi:tripartite-type tricarboxylate transporter receptor subunit TctC
MTHARTAFKALGLALILASWPHAAPAAAKDFPNEKPIRLVVPYPPGGNVDITTRAISTAMARHLKQSIVIENIGGAGGSVGSGNVARAAPDGYTVLSTTIIPLVVNPILSPGTAVRLADFDAAGMMAVVPSLLEVNAKNKHGIKDFKGFIAHAKANPGALAVGHSGTGTTNHITPLLMQRDFGIKITPIPYKGAAPAVADLLGNQIDGMVDQVSSSLPHIESGAFIALAVTSAKRLPQLPNVPTLAEQLGKPDVEIVTYSGLMTPKGTPLAARRALNEALNKAIAEPDVQAQLRRIGSEVVPATVEQATQLFARGEAQLQPLLTSGVLKP